VLQKDPHPGWGRKLRSMGLGPAAQCRASIHGRNRQYCFSFMIPHSDSCGTGRVPHPLRPQCCNPSRRFFSGCPILCGPQCCNPSRRFLQRVPHPLRPQCCNPPEDFFSGCPILCGPQCWNPSRRFLQRVPHLLRPQCCNPPEDSSAAKGGKRKHGDAEKCWI
jgi:hypothetical protein